MKGQTVVRFLLGCALGLVLWFVASLVSGMQTTDVRDFVGGYRDVAILWAFAAPGASAILSGLLLVCIFTRGTVDFLVLHGNQHTIAALVALWSLVVSMVVSEIGMTMAESYPSPTQLVTFFLAYGVTAYMLSYLIAYRRNIVHFILPRHRMINAHA